MQDLHPFGGGGRDRRLRSIPHPAAAALKCPRCDSHNTKFCYYNNYNMSQPRHFCKSCRRYWTRGGVLRNVPVGGGSRKMKSSKSNDNVLPQRSESSSITATAVAVRTAEVASESANPPSSDHPLMDPSTDGQIFQELGRFTSLMASSDEPSLVDFTRTRRLQQSHSWKGVDDYSSKARWVQPPKIDGEEGKAHEMTSARFLEVTSQIDRVAGLHRTDRRSNCGLSPLDWQIGGCQGLFDLTGAVDQSYWNQTQCGENDDDHPLNYLI